MVTITINKNQYQAQEDELLLHALMRLQIDIPHLCSEKMFETYGGCQLCLVDVVTCGKTTMTPACTIRIKNGLEILTDTPEIIHHRDHLIKRYLDEMPTSTAIHKIAAQYGIK